jgi:hypothetical protein
MKLLLAAILFWSGSVLAHKPSDSYLSLDLQGGQTRGQWDIALRDLEYAIGLDANGDAAIDWGELRSKRAALEAYAFSRLMLREGSRACELKSEALLFDEHSDGGYAVLRFSAPCAATDVEYRLFFDLDPTHRGLLRAGASTAVLSPERPSATLGGGSKTALEQFLDYAREGVWHIWIGFDHILFLVSLLLPAVIGARRFAPAFWDVFRIVTAFTVAHSITLALAALSVVSLPSRLVESAIALSVVLAALNNLWPMVRERRWVVAFLFGLVHGFGFASVLADLGLPQEALLLALVGFNLGVEAGQLAIVAAFLPLAWAFRESWGYRRVVFAGGSAAIALVAALWLVERAFDLQLGLL